MTDQEWFEAYKCDVFRMCYYMLQNYDEAEDACQDVFLCAFRQDRSEVLEPKAWLIRIAVNTCRNRIKYRRVKRWKHVLLVNREKAAPPGVSAMHTVERNETKEELATLLGRLPEKIRSAIILKYVYDMKLQDIASMLDIPEGTVKSRIHSGLRKLKKMIEEEGSHYIPGGIVHE